MDIIQKDIGDKINKLRKGKNISMRELGEKVGVSHAHISKLERGINTPSVDLLEKIAKYFNIDVSYFFTQTNEEFTKGERDILDEKELSIEYLKDNYNLVVDGKPATKEEIEEMIKHIKLYRLMKQMEGS